MVSLAASSRDSLALLWRATSLSVEARGGVRSVVNVELRLLGLITRHDLRCCCENYTRRLLFCEIPSGRERERERERERDAIARAKFASRGKSMCGDFWRETVLDKSIARDIV